MTFLSHRKAKAIILFLLGLSLTGILFAFSSGPPLAHTGDFGEPNCTACHTGNPLNSAGGTLTITGVPATYVPGQIYPITVTINRAIQARWGFQLSSRIVSSGLQGGTLVVTDAVGTQIGTASGIQYISHTASGTSAGQAGPKSWTFNWTAPATASGAVRFSCAGNAANNSGSTSGDFIYTTTAISNDPPPVLEIQTDKATYINGESVVLPEFRLRNPGSASVKVELKVFLIAPGVAPISIVNLGADSSFSLPAGHNQNLGPLTLLSIDSSMPRGVYEISSRMLNPVTGALFTEDLNTFTVQ